MSDDRYQFQPWYVKVYRWLRWMPWAYVRGWWWVIRYPSRPEMTKFYDEESGEADWVEMPGINWLTVSKSYACEKMGWWWRPEEILDGLRRRMTG